MAADDADVITLDSDDEDQGASSQISSVAANGGVTIRRISSTPTTIPIMPRPGPSGVSRPSASLKQMPYQMQKKAVPRKPGVFPPFALFSQEHRGEVLKSNSDMGFGDVGRRLGEMWHALSEDEKEGYRRRAREISDQKMAEYQESLRKMPPQQRQIAINQANAPQKRRKTHGYAIFSAEMRKNLGNAMSAQETANVIAESWRSATATVRREYEGRAARLNAAQSKNHMQLKKPPVPIQSGVHRFNNANDSGLRISSVSSLSPSGKLRHPPPTQPSLPAQLGPKLPSGITISRVEPEVSIVAEQQATQPIQPPPRQMGAIGGRGRSIPIKRQAMSPAAQAALRVKAQLAQRSNQGQMFTNGGQWQGAPGRNMAPIRRNLRMPGNGLQNLNAGSGPLKRPLNRPIMMPQGPPAKAPRLRAPNSGQMMGQKMCRVCGLMGPPACRLVDNPEILQALTDLTMTPIDVLKDQMEGYPPEICRRCMSLVTSFSAFKKTFSDGQNRLRLHIEKIRPTMLPLPDDLVAGIGEEQNHTQFASVDIITPSSTTPEEESILPDLDLDMDFGENPANIPQPVDIKQEKVRVITPSDTLRVKEEIGKSMDSENIVEGGSETRVGPKEEKVTSLKTDDDDSKSPKDDVKENPDIKQSLRTDGEKLSSEVKNNEHKNLLENASPDDPLDFNDDTSKSSSDRIREEDKKGADSAAIVNESEDKDDTSADVISSEDHAPLVSSDHENEEKEFLANDDSGLEHQNLEHVPTESMDEVIANNVEGDPEENFTIADDESTGVVPDIEEQMPPAPDEDEDSFVNCNSNSEQGGGNNAIDPFAMDSVAELTEGSQDANDAFQGNLLARNNSNDLEAEASHVSEVSS